MPGPISKNSGRRTSDPSSSGQRSSGSTQARRSMSQAGAENSVPASRWRSRPSSGLPSAAARDAFKDITRLGQPGGTSAAARAAFKDITNDGNASIAGECKAKSTGQDVSCVAGDHSAKLEADVSSDRHILPAPVPLPTVAASAGVAPSNSSSTAQVAQPGVANTSPLADSSSQDDHGDVQSVAEYAPEIYDQLFLKEIAFLPRADYMNFQSDINGRMRAILIDWLVEVHMKYKLRSETLFLTVNILDRYLSFAPVARRSLQLVGVVSMLIAAKFEEITPPEVHDFVFITDNAYTKQDILVLECTMLTALSFQVVAPSPVNFIERACRANHCDGAHRELAQYLIELALLDIRMIRHSPSHLAAAAVLLSNSLLGRRPLWPASMVHSSSYAEASLNTCSEELRGLVDAAPASSLQAVRKKYSAPQHHSVARMTFSAQ